jgi:hypothetical protein
VDVQPVATDVDEFSWWWIASRFKQGLPTVVKSGERQEPTANEQDGSCLPMYSHRGMSKGQYSPSDRPVTDSKRSRETWSFGLLVRSLREFRDRALSIHLTPCFLSLIPYSALESRTHSQGRYIRRGAC